LQSLLLPRRRCGCRSAAHTLIFTHENNSTRTANTAKAKKEIKISQGTQSSRSSSVRELLQSLSRPRCRLCSRSAAHTLPFTHDIKSTQSASIAQPKQEIKSHKEESPDAAVLFESLCNRFRPLDPDMVAVLQRIR
jgi:hypothetical protein